MPGFFLVTIHVLPAGKPLVVGGGCGFFLLLLFLLLKSTPLSKFPTINGAHGDRILPKTKFTCGESIHLQSIGERELWVLL